MPNLPQIAPLHYSYQSEIQDINRPIPRMKHYPILMLFLLFGITASAQQKKVNIDIKAASYTEELSYIDCVIDNFTLHQFVVVGDLKKTTFQKPVDFGGSTFSHAANWDSSIFLDTVFFDRVTFSDTASFVEVTFSKHPSFFSATFLGQAMFESAVFPGEVNFNGAKFLKTASFDQAAFSKQTDFVKSNFSHGAHFAYVKFSDRVNFIDAAFNGHSSLSLMNLALGDSTHFRFDDTVLPDTIYFSDNTQIKNEIDFLHANFTTESRYDYNINRPKPILIYLYNTDIAKLRLDYTHFKLLLPDSTIDTEGPSKSISPDDKSSVYEALLNNFKTNGQTESYELLDVEYQQFKWKHSWTHWIPCIPKYWWNFGYDKEYIFGWTFLLLLVFTCFSFIYIHSLNTKVYAMEKIPTNPAWEKKLSLKDFGNRLWYSFMYTSTVFFMLSLKIENVQFKEKRGTFYLVTVYSIGLICIGYVANFILQK
jgi:uncharacterized protein YjbI with pentapeptide repeats